MSTPMGRMMARGRLLVTERWESLLPRSGDLTGMHVPLHRYRAQ